jgi:signal transduction histidine kinase
VFFGNLLRAPHRLLSLFLVLTLVPAIALVWLGWRFLEQDGLGEERRVQEHREQAADLIVAALQQAITADEQRLGDPTNWPELAREDAVVIDTGPDSVETQPQNRLLYYPFSQPLPEASPDLFRSGEDDESPLQNYPAASEKFRKLAHASDAATRAGAMLRLARVERESGQPLAALNIYADLSGLKGVAVRGAPADLVALHARCMVLAELGHSEELRLEAEQLHRELFAARWRLERSAFLFYLSDVDGWLGLNDDVELADSMTALITGVVEQLWENSHNLSNEAKSNVLRPEILKTPAGFGAVILNRSHDRLVALAAGPAYVKSRWRRTIEPLLASQGMQLTLQDPILPASAGRFETHRDVSETGLPWRMIVAEANPQVELARAATQGRLLLSGLVLLLIMVVTGSYFVARAVTRELALARLQTDFVAAVSHEFRTPLTSLGQTAEILTDGRITDPGRLRTYYEAQSRATRRLQRLVESLLEFGRMEGGRKPYRKEPLSPAVLVRSVVDEFQGEAAAAGYTIELHADDDSPSIVGDYDALARALRNLLENAVKYSPECRTVWVDLANSKGRVTISVRDRGLGIPRDEQKQIFSKFVRGAAAKRNGIKGTGIGLAMVEHIVRGHGGEIRLESEPAKGSAFTILL